MAESFWPKDRLIAHTLFELCLFRYLHLVQSTYFRDTLFFYGDTHLYLSLVLGVSLNKAWEKEFLKSYPDLNVDWKSVLSRYNYHFGNLDSISQNAQPKDLGSSGKYIFIIFIIM